MSPGGFRWTVILTPDEIEALDWIKTNTPPDALVQVHQRRTDPRPGRTCLRSASGGWPPGCQSR